MSNLPAGVTEARVEAGARGIARHRGHMSSSMWNYMKSVWIAESRACLTAALEGSVVVPREPTPEIVKAYIAADPRRRRFAASAKRDYRAMIAAVDGGA